MIDHVIWNADMLSDASRVVYVIERATPARHRLGHAFMPGKPPLIPQLHGQPDNVMPFSAQHGRYGGRIDSARHCYGDGLRIWHGWLRANRLSFIPRRKLP